MATKKTATTTMADVNALLDTTVGVIKDQLLVITQGNEAVKAAKEAAKENNHAKAARTREVLREYLIASGLNPLVAGSLVLTKVCQGLAEVVADKKTLAKKKQDAGVSVSKAFESITRTKVKAVCTNSEVHIYALEIVEAEAEKSPEELAVELIKKWEKDGIDSYAVLNALRNQLHAKAEKAAAMEAARQSIQIFA